MKTTLVLTLLLGTLCPGFSQTATPPTPAQISARFYKQGQQAEKAGDPVAAQAAYAQALKADPNNANARYSLGQIKINASAVSAKGREAKVGAVMIPAYQLDGASLQEALEALNTLIAKESKNEIAPNFVVDDPKSALTQHKITLNLKNMPTKAILKYLTDQTGSKVRYDEHAVVISPR